MRRIMPVLSLAMLALLSAVGLRSLLQENHRVVHAQAAPPTAWSILRRLIDANGDPVWPEWCALADTADGSDTVSCPRSSSPGLMVKQRRLSLTLQGLHRPRQLQNDSQLLSPQGSVRVAAGIVLNDVARKSLQSQILNHCHSTSPSTATIACGLTELLGINTPPSFEEGSMIVKTTWAVVPAGAGASPRSVPLSNKRSTERTMFIDGSDPAAPCKPTGSTVNASCFYGFFVKASDLASLRPDIVNFFRGANATVYYPGPYYLLLLGFNVMVKHNKTWYWQTFWWDLQTFANDPVWAQTYENGNPLSGLRPWKHYVKDEMASGSGLPVYNPYLEGNQRGGAKSNCFSCHSYAHFHTNPSMTDSHVPDCYLHTAVNLALGISATPHCNDLNYAATLQGGLATDFVWNLADSNDAARHDAHANPASPPQVLQR